MRLISTSLLICCLVDPGVGPDPTPAKMIWQAGQVYSYRSNTPPRRWTASATPERDEERDARRSATGSVPPWTPAGVATPRCRVEQWFRAYDADGRDAPVRLGQSRQEYAALKDVMKKFLNTPLAVIRIDPKGKVVD